LKAKTAAKARTTRASGAPIPEAPDPPGTVEDVVGAAEVLEDVEELVFDPEVEAEVLADVLVDEPVLVVEAPVEVVAAELLVEAVVDAVDEAPEVDDAPEVEAEAVAPMSWNCVP